MSDKPPPHPERRSDDRHLSLFRVGSILIGDRRELCLVKNISSGGALVRAYCSLKPGSKIQIELKEGQPVAGEVSWRKGTDAGITFQSRVDVLELIKADADGPRPRMPRIEVACVGFVRDGAVVHRSQVKNISQGGMSVETSGAIEAGADVTVSLPGLPPQGASVRWKKDDCYGITFNTILPLATLVDWLHARQGC